jgi:hypothetical protein
VGYNTDLWNLTSNRLPRLKTTTGGDFDEAQNPTLP